MANVMRTAMLEIDLPELFAREDFRKWLNGSAASNVATWHAQGEDPNEYSDLFVTYDGGEGSNSDMPGWDLVCQIAREEGFRAGTIRLTNIGQ
jgi:hypothetical protein